MAVAAGTDQGSRDLPWLLLIPHNPELEHPGKVSRAMLTPDAPSLHGAEERIASFPEK